MKGALLTLAQPLLNVIIPAFTAFVNVLARIVSAIASVVSALFGTTVEASAEAAENLYNEANAVEGVGSAAKKASKSLASFDEINQLSGSEASAGGGGGGGASEGIKPIFEDFSTEEYKQKIDELTVYVSGALWRWVRYLHFRASIFRLALHSWLLERSDLYRLSRRTGALLTDLCRRPLQVCL